MKGDKGSPALPTGVPLVDLGIVCAGAAPDPGRSIAEEVPLAFLDRLVRPEVFWAMA